MSGSGDGKFLAVALGFTTATAITLSLVLLGFAVIGDVEPGFLGEKESPTLAAVEIRGFNATLEAMGAAEAICVDGAMLRADGLNRLVYFIVKFESESLTAYIDSSQVVFYAGGKIHYTITPERTSYSEARCVEVGDAITPTGGVEVAPGGEVRLVFAFPVTTEYKSGTLEIPVALGRIKYTFTITIEKCKIIEASLSYAG